MPIPVRQRREAAQNPEKTPQAARPAPKPAKPPKGQKAPKGQPPKPKVKPPAPATPPRPQLAVFRRGNEFRMLDLGKTIDDSWQRVELPVEPINADAVRDRRFTRRNLKNIADPPKEPMKLADFPADLPILRGYLKSMTGLGQRPFVFIKIICPYCDHDRTLPWRGDWPVDETIGLLQKIRCEGGIDRVFLITLDPEKHEQNEQTLVAAQAAFEPWKAEFDRRRAEKKARKRARREAEEAAKAGGKTDG
jgi:hypothetical protein